MAAGSGMIAAGEALLPAGMARQPAWRRWLAANERLALGVSGFVVVTALWELAVRAGLIKALWVSSPSAIVQTFVESASGGTLWRDLTVSLEEFVLGYVAAAILGIAAGFAAGWYRRVNYVASPWIAAWYATPHIALVPLIILWFGIGLTYKVFYVFLVSFFAITINTLVGVQSAEARYVEVAHSFRASQMMLLRSVVLPGSVPFILTGLRLAAGHAWVGVVVAELIGSNQGLGFMINIAGQMLDTNQAMMGVVILGMLGVILAEAVGRVEKRFAVWRPQLRTGN